MAENYKAMYEQTAKILDKYQDEIVPKMRLEIERVRKELNAALKDLKSVHGKCWYCKYGATLGRCKKPNNDFVDCWEWRGTMEVQK